MPIYTFEAQDQSGRIRRGRAMGRTTESLTRRLQAAGFQVRTTSPVKDPTLDPRLYAGDVLWDDPHDAPTRQPGEEASPPGEKLHKQEPSASPARLSDYWTPEPQPDGSLRLIKASGQSGAAGCFLAFAVLFNLILFVLILAELNASPHDHSQHESDCPALCNASIGWTGYVAFGVVGFCLLIGALLPFFTEQECRAARNSLTLRSRPKFLKKWQGKRHTAQILEIEHLQPDQGSPYWELSATEKYTEMTPVRTHLFSAHTPDEYEVLHEFANLLSLHTEWKIYSTSTPAPPTEAPN